jgi:hypothetical protein
LHILADEDTNVDEIAWEHHGMWPINSRITPPLLFIFFCFVAYVQLTGRFCTPLKVSGNYLMKKAWGEHAAQLTLRESYEYFLKMRNKGIRAHSWI